MNTKTFLVSIIGYLILSFLSSACVGKRPDDEVAMIKKVLATFERGVDQKSQTVLDSVMQDKRLNLSSPLLDNLYREREYEGARIASKSFVVVGDSAEVRLTLSLEYGANQGEPRRIEKPLRLYLNKKRGKWRIEAFSAATDEGVLEEPGGP